MNKMETTLTTRVLTPRTARRKNGVVPELTFYKMEASGTDYIVVDNMAGYHDELFADSDLLQSLCDRKEGIGGTAAVEIRRHQQTKFEMKFYNAQGKEGGFCANAACCVIALLCQQGLAPPSGFKFTARDGEHKAFYDAETSLPAVQVKTTGSIKTYNFLNYFVNTGAPYHVMYVLDNLLTIDVQKLGRKISRDSRYADIGGSNVLFVQLTNDGELKARAYDRGSDREIFGSGTGAAACVAVEATRAHGSLPAVTSQSRDRKYVSVQFPGGVFVIEFSLSDNLYLTNMVLTQNVTKLFQGKMRATSE